jgi:ABC-type dipeptide/oligopeptide/nickel transport system permease component
MKYMGLSLLLILPLAIICVSLLIFSIFYFSRHTSIKKAIKQNYLTDKGKIVNQIREEMGIDDLKKGHKEIMDDLTKKDIRDIFK